MPWQQLGLALLAGGLAGWLLAASHSMPEIVTRPSQSADRQFERALFPRHNDLHADGACATNTVEPAASANGLLPEALCRQ